MNIKWKPLSASDGKDVYDMLQEISRDENGFVNNIWGRTYEAFEQWLVKSEKTAKGIGLEDGKVPQNIYWLYVDGQPVGMGKLRHFLTDALREEGGHGGYAVRPSQRGKGYGKLILKYLLDEAKKLGIERFLVTVRNANAASIKVALANGGVIERYDEIRHYIWIDC